MSGPVDNRDVEFWKNSVSNVVEQPSETLNRSSPGSAQSWTSSLFGCFNPIDLCLVSWCLPCVTFGKTHHRLQRDANLEGYNHVNSSCLLFCGASCCGLYWIPLALQRAEIRDRFNLRGNCLGDFAKACCCAGCDLVQQEKEAVERAPLAPKVGGAEQGYAPQGGMAYPTHPQGQQVQGQYAMKAQ